MFSAKKFRVLLTDSGMSVKQFSKKAGVSDVTIGKILNHGTKPKIETVGKLAKGLQVSSEKLMKDD